MEISFSEFILDMDSRWKNAFRVFTNIKASEMDTTMKARAEWMRLLLELKNKKLT